MTAIPPKCQTSLLSFGCIKGPMQMIVIMAAFIHQEAQALGTFDTSLITSEATCRKASFAFPVIPPESSSAQPAPQTSSSKAVRQMQPLRYWHQVQFLTTGEKKRTSKRYIHGPTSCHGDLPTLDKELASGVDEWAWIWMTRDRT